MSLFVGAFVIRGGHTEETTLGSGKACRRDQRVGFERGSVVGETFDGIFDELPGSRICPASSRTVEGETSVK